MFRGFCIISSSIFAACSTTTEASGALRRPQFLMRGCPLSNSACLQRTKQTRAPCELLRSALGIDGLRRLADRAFAYGTLADRGFPNARRIYRSRLPARQVGGCSSAHDPYGRSGSDKNLHHDFPLCLTNVQSRRATPGNVPRRAATKPKAAPPLHGQNDLTADVLQSESGRFT